MSIAAYNITDLLSVNRGSIVSAVRTEPYDIQRATNQANGQGLPGRLRDRGHALTLSLT
jgi:hypothetical protein